MPLIESLTYALGPAIATTILKLWLKNDGHLSIIDGAADVIYDLIKERTKDVIAVRNGARQFEAIGDAVAMSLLPVFEAERARLDEGGMIAVANAVASTIGRSRINLEFLISNNLDPVELERRFGAYETNEVRLLSDGETALYRRILAESSQIIVDTASQLPAYSERTIAQLLKNQNELLGKANLLLEDLSRIRQGSELLEIGVRQFEVDYRNSVVRAFDNLELFGLDVSTASRRHRLSVAYVELWMIPDTTRKFEAAGAVPVADIIPRTTRLFVSGVPGSGKTTLLQWIAVKSALHDFPEKLAILNETTPFLIRLREYANTKLPAPEEFPQLGARPIVGKMPQGWVHAALASGKAIVLIDGVDELPGTRRKEVYSWLEELINTFGTSRYIVTSRPYAVSDIWLKGQNFNHAELQAMDMSAIDEFIDHWHRAVREELHTESEKAELNRLPLSLKKTIRRSESIRSLATNPLLCAMLCALHRDRRQQLPTDRIELYEAGCYMLLERRDKERQLEYRNYPHLTYRQKRALLQDLAYWMMKNGWSAIDISKANRRLSQRITSIQSISIETKGSKVCRYLIERSGIVREPIAGKLDFAHKTFQEFLAAQAILDEDDLGVLVKNAHDDQWREVVILAAGLGNAKTSNNLISALITRGDTESQWRHRLHLTAIACLGTALKIRADVQTQVKDRLEKLIPPNTRDDAQALASAGELAVPHLVARPEYSEMSASMCVRALVMIGGDHALEVLSGFASDSREAVVAELLRGWGVFANKEYAERIMASVVVHHTRLSLERVSTLDGFEHLKNLTHLKLMDCWMIKNLEPLGNLTKLQKLTLWNGRTVTSLAPLAFLSDLVELDLIQFTSVTNIKPIEQLTQLESLDLRGCTGIIDITPLGAIRNLKKLSLSGCEGVTDISPLFKLKRLVWLNLTNVSVSDVNISHFDELKRMRPLQIVGL